MTSFTRNFKLAVTVAAFLNLCLLVSSLEDCQERNIAKVEEDRTCRKSCRSQSDCRGGRKRCVCDDVCGLSCHNPNATCSPDLESIDNGDYEGQNRYKERVVYSCHKGYEIRGNSERVCRSNRMWSSPAPTCVAPCKTPRGSSTAYPRATKNNYDPGETLEFQCRPGYILASEGDPVITCQASGKWTEATYTCTKVQCAYPGELDNGLIEGENYEFGSQIQLRCNRGYTLNSPIEGQNYLTCNTESTWTPNFDDFNCQIVECEAPQRPEHGSVDLVGVRNFRYSQPVTYSCDFGYKLIGSSVRRCEEDATWGEIPVCEIDDDCDFENSARSTCGFTNHGWSRKFSNDVPNERRGYLANVEFPAGRRESTANLTSPSLLRNNSLCLRFYYKISDNDNSLTFRLRVTKENRNIWKYTQSHQKNTWLSYDHWFQPEAGNFRFYFEAIKRASQSPAVVEMDDITTTISDRAACVGVLTTTATTTTESSTVSTTQTNVITSKPMLTSKVVDSEKTSSVVVTEGKAVTKISVTTKANGVKTIVSVESSTASTTQTNVITSKPMLSSKVVDSEKTSSVVVTEGKAVTKISVTTKANEITMKSTKPYQVDSSTAATQSMSTLSTTKPMISGRVKASTSQGQDIEPEPDSTATTNGFDISTSPSNESGSLSITTIVLIIVAVVVGVVIIALLIFFLFKPPSSGVKADIPTTEEENHLNEKETTIA